MLKLTSFTVLPQFSWYFSGVLSLALRIFKAHTLSLFGIESIPSYTNFSPELGHMEAAPSLSS